MGNSSFLSDSSGFTPSFVSSQALQGAFERIARIPTPQAHVEISLWNDGWGDFSDHVDCPADD